MASDNLHFGMGLEPDIKEFEKTWKAKEKEIQGIIDQHTFQVKVEASTDLDAMKNKLQEIVDLQRQMTKPLTAYQAGKLQIQQQVALLKQEADATNKAAVAQQKKATEAERTAAAHARAEAAQLRLTRAQQRSISTTNAQTSAFRTQAGVLNGVKQFMNSYLSVLGAFRLVSNIEKITAEFELQAVSLRAITQNAEFADNLFNKIKATAVESPFSVKEMITYTKQLAAYRIENEKLYDTTNMLADVSAGLGVDMNRLILAYGQVKAASVLRGQELRQFTEAGIPLVEQLAVKFSQLKNEVVSTSDVFELISKREVPFEMVAEIFRDMTEEGGKFYNMQKIQAESLYGIWANLKDNLQVSLDEIGKANREFLADTGKLLTFFAKHLDALIDTLGIGVTTFVAFKAASIAAGNAEKALAISTNLVAAANNRLAASEALATTARRASLHSMWMARKANDMYAFYTAKASLANNVFARSFWKLTAAIAANPIGAAITALVGTIAAVVTVYNRKIEKLRSADQAQKAVANSMKAINKQQEEETRAVDKNVKAVKEQDALVRSQEKTYKEFSKIYPELAKQYKSEEEYQEALKNAYDNRKEALIKLREQYPDYFGDIDIEKFKIEDLTRLYAKLDESQRKSKKEFLEGQISEIEDSLEKYKQYKPKMYDLASTPKEDWTAEQKKFEFLLGARQRVILAALQGLIERLKSLRQELQGVTQASENAKDAQIKWRQVYNENIEKQSESDEGLANDKLAVLSVAAAIDETRKRYKASTRAVEDYTKAINSQQRALKKATTEQEKADIQKSIDWTKERLAEAQKQIQGQKTFAEYMGFDLEDDKGNRKQIQELQSRYNLYKEIYKKYEDLRKSMSDEDARNEIKDIYKDMFGGDPNKINFLNPEAYKKALGEIQDEAKKLGEVRLSVNVGLERSGVDFDELKKELSRKLEKLSQEVSRTKAGADLFKNILGLTGDENIATKITMTLTGVNIAEKSVKNALVNQLATILGHNAIKDEVQATLGLSISEDENPEAYIERIKDAILSGAVSVEPFNKLIASINDKDLKSKLESSLSSYYDYNKALLDDFFKTIDATKDYTTKKEFLGTQAKMKLNKEDDFASALLSAGIDENTVNTYLEKWRVAIQKGLDNEIAKLNLDEFKDIFASELEELDSLTSTTLNRMIEHLEGLAAAAQDTASLKAYLDLLKQLKDEYIQKAPVTSFIEGSKEVKEGRKMQKEGKAKGDSKMIQDGINKQVVGYKKMQKSAQAMRQYIDNYANALNGVVDIVQQITDAFGVKLGPEAQAAIKGITLGFSIMSTALGVVSSVLLIITSEVAALETLLWPLLLIALALAAAFAVFMAVDAHKKKQHEQALEGIDKRLQKLKKSYEDLEYIEEKGLGKDWIVNQSEQIKNLEGQVVELGKKISEEKSMGKKADKDKIKDWEDEQEDAYKKIREIRDKFVKEMTGTDLTSAAKDFAEAWLDAYLSFSNTTDAIKEKFQEMMKNLIVNSVLARVVQAKLAPLFKYIDEEMFDKDTGEMIGSLDKVWDMMKSVTETLPDELRATIEKYDFIRELRGSESDLTGIAEGVATASEESVVTLAGYANSILYYHVKEASDLAAIRAILEGRAVVSTNVSQRASSEPGSLNVGQLIALQQDLLSQVILIKEDTGAIRRDISDIKDDIRAVVSGVSVQSPKTVNVKIRA